MFTFRENCWLCVTRRKRDILMMPGTKWCGAGHRAKGYKDLGAEQAVDYCCRRHDHCPETIRSKITRYGVTNSRPITVSLCDCDERSVLCPSVSVRALILCFLSDETNDHWLHTN